MRLMLAALALATATPTLAAPAKAPASPAGERWWATVKELADDKYEGRLTGTPGYQRAADYVAGQFKALGLKPAGTDGYFQTVRFVEQTVDAGKSSVRLSGAGGDRALDIGEDLLLSSRVHQLPEVKDVPLVFIGYGLHLPEAGYDDFAGLDLKGKVVVYLSGGPSSLSGALKSHARAAEFWPALERAGALGAIDIANPKSSDVPWPRQRLASAAPGMVLADPSLRDFHAPHFSARMNPEQADKLFAPAGRKFADLLALADKGEPLPRFDLNQRLTATVSAAQRELTAPNVAALLPGRSPKLKAEYVVLSAHLDHVGVGAPINGDRVYNGAMDNASGVASLIEAARALTKRPPARSVLFVAVTAEERGLLGSRYFAARPTVAQKDVAANINMDMFLPIFPLKTMTAFGQDESTLGPVIAAAAKRAGVRLIPDPAPDRNIFVRSDQYSFVRVGIPALMLDFQPTTDADKALEAEFLKNRYHAPSDDANQPVNLAAAAKFNALLADTIEAVANALQRPAWNKDSFFRRFDKRAEAGAAGK